jgi:hypothetical protein
MSETFALAGRRNGADFDDGPLPHYSNQILEILGTLREGTFFTIGRM